MTELQDRAASLAQALEQHADAGAALVNAQLAVNAEIRLLVDTVEKVEAESQAMAEKLKMPPPSSGHWGPGPYSGHRWWSGVSWRGSLESLNTFVAGPRNGVKVDLVQLFSPANAPLAHDWSMIAGGPGDNPELLDGTLTFTKGSKQGALIWTDPVIGGLPVAYTVRPIPVGPDSNEDGRNPGIWESIAKGEKDPVYRMLGRRFAFLDQRHNRTAPLILEIGHEMNGDWYPWSIEGTLTDGRFAWQVFPSAWARIVDAIREGYLAQAGRHCPYTFCFRPARTVLAGAVRLDKFLPPPGTWDVIGITAHDNAPYHTEAAPKAAWTQGGSMEGWLLLAELAERFRKGVAILEWGGYPPDSSTVKSSPRGELFVASFWDFCNQIKHLMAAEAYFDRASLSFSDRPGWTATQAYRERWGRS